MDNIGTKPSKSLRIFLWLIGITAVLRPAFFLYNGLVMHYAFRQVSFVFSLATSVPAGYAIFAMAKGNKRGLRLAYWYLSLSFLGCFYMWNVRFDGYLFHILLTIVIFGLLVYASWAKEMRQNHPDTKPLRLLHIGWVVVCAIILLIGVLVEFGSTPNERLGQKYETALHDEKRLILPNYVDQTPVHFEYSYDSCRLTAVFGLKEGRTIDTARADYLERCKQQFVLQMQESRFASRMALDSQELRVMIMDPQNPTPVADFVITPDEWDL